METATLLALVVVAIATPGPTVLLALSNGPRFGLRRSLPGLAGAVVSDFVLVGAASTAVRDDRHRFAGVDFAVMLAYAATGAHAARRLQRSTVLWLDRICGGALLMLLGVLPFFRRGNA